ncbi:PH domain-containing protein [Chloropicon primus]|uniref:PH domain-containing protein n=2 Tax=Chloropicon primus TaxID=1764295 RepID=A0A5B8MWS0_9CHLO|nr:hypothetical protein A3770_14p72690 [Chloropicon primus]UPR03957.1 PH domain-containing protein [Chloropicon primus]|eukprot:QDZ24751.1 hypothetical protein A3770_14p72690 [Chloropicon primus]
MEEEEEEEDATWYDSLENAFDMDGTASLSTIVEEEENVPGSMYMVASGHEIQKVFALYSNGLLLKAYDALCKVKEEGCSILKAKLDEVKRAYGRYQQSSEETEDPHGYTVAHQARPKVSYRHLRGSKVHSVKLEMDLDFPLERVWAMGWEFDLLDTWNPYAIEPKVLTTENDQELTLNTAVWLPWPFHPRELYVHVKWYDLLEEQGCFFVTLHDIEYENKLKESYILDREDNGRGEPKKKRKRERAALLKGSCAWVWPERDPENSCSRKTRVLFSMHADPLVFSPPNWLVNFVLKLMAPTIYKTLVKALHEIYGKGSSSEYPRRVGAKKLYTVLRERVEKAELLG